MSQESTLQMTVAERVAEQLRDEIRQKVLAPGEPLRQNDVAARLGVSSTPVREAFQILERMGLVEREGRRGVRVFRPSIRDLIEAYEVREGLESLAASLAAERLTDEALASIQQVMDRMRRPDISQQEFLRLNADFHMLVARRSGNARLKSLVESELTATASFVAFLGVDPASADEAHEEHTAIFAALQRRDPAGAAASMAAHLRTRVDALRSRLDAADHAAVLRDL